MSSDTLVVDLDIGCVNGALNFDRVEPPEPQQHFLHAKQQERTTAFKCDPQFSFGSLFTLARWLCSRENTGPVIEAHLTSSAVATSKGVRLTLHKQMSLQLQINHENIVTSTSSIASESQQ
jgi:hypothetical protein